MYGGRERERHSEREREMLRLRALHSNLGHAKQTQYYRSTHKEEPQPLADWSVLAAAQCSDSLVLSLDVGYIPLPISPGGGRPDYRHISQEGLLGYMLLPL